MNAHGFLRLIAPVLGLLLFSLSACSSLEEYDTTTAEGTFKLAERYVSDERYEEAVVLFAEVKNKFPYSKLATEAELKIADVQFERESYIEAQTAYEVFKELHPKHPRSDYVTYRLGMSLYNQLPSSTDRDLSLAERAIVYFEEVIRSYPSSKFVADSKKHRLKAREMLAEKQLYIGDFYSKRDMHESSLARYEALLKSFPETTLVPQALAAASKSALAADDKSKAAFYFGQLKERFPKSPEFSTLQSEIGNELSQQQRK